MADRREPVAALIEKGFLQAERGESIDGDAAAEMLKAAARGAAQDARVSAPFQFHAAGDATHVIVYRPETTP